VWKAGGKVTEAMIVGYRTQPRSSGCWRSYLGVEGGSAMPNHRGYFTDQSARIDIEPIKGEDPCDL
jgi:hypothetical protein